MTLLEEARSGLIAARKTTRLHEISDKAGVSMAWLSRFERGYIDNPGVLQIDALLTYLRAREG